MAQFEGTISEFTKFLGAYCRIKVMHISTKYRKGKGKCEECESTKNLEAAHVRGKERPVIISNILSQYLEDSIVKVDLTEFQERFVEAHMPIEKTIRILCKECHRIYDRVSTIPEYMPSAENIENVLEIEKLETKESQVIEALIKLKLNKSTAIDIINKKNGNNLNHSNTLFSNLNELDENFWWLQPKNEKFKTGFNFILNYPENRALFHFYVPSETISNPQAIFKQRTDMSASTIYIPKSASKFIERNGFDFRKFLVDQVEY